MVVSSHIREQPLRSEAAVQVLLKMIQDEGLRVGDRLLAEKKLAVSLGINHLTLRKALAVLDRDGIIEKIPGRGNFLRRSPKGAKGASTGQTRDVGNGIPVDRLIPVVMRNDEHFFSHQRDLVFTELQRRGYFPIPCPAHPFDQKSLSSLRAALLQGSQRLILDGNVATNVPELRELVAGELSAMRTIRVLGSVLDDGGLQGPLVTADFVAGYGAAIEHLQALGHRRIGFCCGGIDPDHCAARQNQAYIRSYTEAMLAANLAEGISVYCIDADANGVEALLAQLVSCVSRPTALICDIDYRAVLLIDEAKRIGLSVPEELSVVGGFNTPWAQHYQLTTLEFPAAAVAEAAVDSLLSSRPQLSPQLFPLTLNIHTSTAPISLTKESD